MSYVWSAALAVPLLVGGRPVRAMPAPERVDTSALEFFGVRAGATIAELNARISARGDRLHCKASRADRHVTECRGRLDDPRLGGPVALWVSAVDSAAGVITVSGPVATDQLAYWRRTVERRYGRVDAHAQGSQWMMQWVRRGRMLRLTWRINGGRKEASVSLVDGRILDRWGRSRAQPASSTRKLPSDSSSR